MSRMLLFFLLVTVYHECHGKLLSKSDFADVCKEGLDLSFRGFNDSEISELLTKKLLDKYVSDMEPITTRGGKVPDNCGTAIYAYACQYGLLDELFFLWKQMTLVIFRIPLFLIGTYPGYPVLPDYPRPVEYVKPVEYYPSPYYGDSYGEYYPNSYGSGYVAKNQFEYGRQDTPITNAPTFQPQDRPRPHHPSPSPYRHRYGRRELVAQCDRIEFPDAFDLKSLKDIGSFVRTLKIRSETRIPENILNGLFNTLKHGSKASSSKASAQNDLPNTRDEKFGESEAVAEVVEVPTDLVVEQPSEQPVETNTEETPQETF